MNGRKTVNKNAKKEEKVINERRIRKEKKNKK